jgi:biotin carboxyl carrier protein
MRYSVTIDGVEREIDVQITDDGTVSVSIEGAAVEVDAVRVPGGVSLRIDGRVYDVVVGGRAEARQIAAGDRRAVGAVENDRSRAKKARRKTAGMGTKELRAPMPGRVVKILVKPGDAVTADEPVIVIEAMKMENELRAAAAGKVKSVEVVEDQKIEGDAVLVRFE